MHLASAWYHDQVALSSVRCCQHLDGSAWPSKSLPFKVSDFFFQPVQGVRIGSTRHRTDYLPSFDLVSANLRFQDAFYSAEIPVKRNYAVIDRTSIAYHLIKRS